MELRLLDCGDGTKMRIHRTVAARAAAPRRRAAGLRLAAALGALSLAACSSGSTTASSSAAVAASHEGASSGENLRGGADTTAPPAPLTLDSAAKAFVQTHGSLAPRVGLEKDINADGTLHELTTQETDAIDSWPTNAADIGVHHWIIQTIADDDAQVGMRWNAFAQDPDTRKMKLVLSFAYLREMSSKNTNKTCDGLIKTAIIMAGATEGEGAAQDSALLSIFGCAGGRPDERNTVLTPASTTLSAAAAVVDAYIGAQFATLTSTPEGKCLLPKGSDPNPKFGASLNTMLKCASLASQPPFISAENLRSWSGDKSAMGHEYVVAYNAALLLQATPAAASSSGHDELRHH